MGICVVGRSGRGNMSVEKKVGFFVNEDNGEELGRD
jgi:hypothetical protein